MIRIKKEKHAQRLVYVPTRLILVGENPVRESFDEEELCRLADSIKRHGLLQPLKVRALSEKNGAEVYELVSGRRRLRACKLLCIPTVPCIVGEFDETSALEAALCENLIRSDLDMFEQAEAISSLMKISMLSTSQVAQRLSVSESFVTRKLRLLSFQKHERQLVLFAGLDEDKALELSKMQGSEKRLRVLNAVLEGRDTPSEAVEEPEDKPRERSEQRQQIKSVLKDKRIFINTIERAVATLRAGGGNVYFDKSENGSGETVMTIKISSL